MPFKFTKKLTCCEKCQNYWTCETKWYRGEHNKTNICCSLCAFYTQCWEPLLPGAKNKRKKK